MESLKTQTAQLKDHVGEYVQATVQLAKVKATKGASNAAAGAAIGIATLVLGLFFLAFLFTALAWWLSSLLESPALGFLCVAGLFLLLIVLLFALRKKVIVPLIRNAIIGAVYDKKD
ncbi:MAG TPA: phage holin family protein [Flavisolibacter sp.]|jgi:protein-S-isoprenylcysteine O-methyltransferase Ste14|nr:phage holin family protein [Flavisolibacter sp.]